MSMFTQLQIIQSALATLPAFMLFIVAAVAYHCSRRR